MPSIDTLFTAEQALPEGAYDLAVLAHKNVLITGGTSGVGLACAKAYIKAGALVTIAGTNLEEGTRLADELDVVFVQTDVRSWEQQLVLFNTALDRGPLDVVIVNAGVSGADDIVKQTGEPQKPDLHIVEINLIGALYTISLAQHFLHSGSSIIITASLASYVDQPGTPQYNASKFGVRGIMRSLRRTDPARGLRINIVAPWYMPAKILSPEVLAKIKSKGVPFAEVDDAAQAFLHISSLPSLNGRAIAVLPRSMHPRGYMDIGRDDVDSDELLGTWQHLALQASARVD